jgi:predicted Zn-dependent protease with MMP-like domain
MKAAKYKIVDELRMNAEEFDNIMSKAFQVIPEEAPKPKKSAKASRKKDRAKK